MAWPPGCAYRYSHSKIGTVTPFLNNATHLEPPSAPGRASGPPLFIGPNRHGRPRPDAGRAVEIPDPRSDFACIFATTVYRRRGRSMRMPSAVRPPRGKRLLCPGVQGWDGVRPSGVRHIRVSHAGEVSFGPNSPGKEKSWRILIERHPDYPRLVAEHVSRDPQRPTASRPPPHYSARPPSTLFF